MNQKLELLKKLHKAHKVYQRCTNEQKGRLIDAMEPVFVELEGHRMPRIVSESLLMFGSEFYWAEHLAAAGDVALEATFGQEGQPA